MFRSARIKLTTWYLLIIMVISAVFSLAIYKVLTNEIERGLRIQRYRILRPNNIFSSPTLYSVLPPDPEIINEIKERIQLYLLFINLGILSLSSVAGYFLAGQTLEPIENMVEDQKRFISDASHELRTPLTSLKTEIEVALRDKKLDLKNARQLLGSNLEEVDKIETLSNYLLTLNRYQTTHPNLAFEKVDLSKVIDESIKNIKSIAKRKEISIIKELHNITISGNAVSLRELCTILLDNAIKYSHYNNKIIVRLYKQKNRSNIEIKDFGIGIKASELPYLFNRFYRGDSSRSKTPVIGYGLGLSIAKSIVDLHHGKISVQSSLGEGTTFRVSLPIGKENIIVT